jgi:NosR/NirI family transcriptional regulator, nitrous oxide reductase regulator
MYLRFLLILIAGLLLPGQLGARDGGDLTLEQVRMVFPAARDIAVLDGNAPAYLVRDDRVTLGYAFSTKDVSPISAYSGKPINTLVGVGQKGKILGIHILHHEEPILVIGVSDADLETFVSQFEGKTVADRVRVGAFDRKGYTGIDGITGATITTMVLTSSVNKSLKEVAAAYGITSGAARPTSLPDEPPAWQLLWHAKWLELSLVSIALLLLLVILFIQDWLVERTVFFHRLRVGYLLFTVFFIGFYCSAQLSVINMLAFFHSMSSGFSWDTLLIEPVIFLLWAFVAVSILLWGRGVYCGWLCPFGAAQDLISKATTRLGFEGYRLPQMLHERLWSIKYFILIVLVGLSLDSMVSAARFAEVEPFKTTFVLRFMREPQFVVYAVLLLALSALNSKFYCKYMCPLGAGLSFITRFRIFDWLRRRPECGKPCQSCAHQCQIAAIRPTGEIIDNECHYCLECQVSYWDDHRCPPLVEKRKKREVLDKGKSGVIASGS